MGTLQTNILRINKHQRKNMKLMSDIMSFFWPFSGTKKKKKSAQLTKDTKERIFCTSKRGPNLDMWLKLLKIWFYSIYKTNHWLKRTILMNKNIYKHQNNEILQQTSAHSMTSIIKCQKGNVFSCWVRHELKNWNGCIWKLWIQYI